MQRGRRVPYKEKGKSVPYNLFAEFASTALMIVFVVGVHCDEVL